MGWWVLTYLNNDRDWTDLTVLAETNHPAHLIMAWSTVEPARRPIYRIVRGKRVFCGWKYIWDTPNLTEQIQHLDTFEHLFHIHDLNPLDHIWYLLSSTKKMYERYCQSALIHVPPMPPDQPCYYVYLATRSKGIFRTVTFSGPGPLQPYWSADNEGLLSLAITQAVIDPFNRYRRRYLIAGGHLHMHFNIVPFQPAISATILTNPQAFALTGSIAGKIMWVAANPNHPGMLHVFWHRDAAFNAFWHIRTLDYGEHWTAHPLDPTIYSCNPGNMQAGRHKGTSPYTAGDVLYAALNFELLIKPHIARSIDQGITWTILDTPDIPRGSFRPRLYVDPADQSVVYLGSHPYSGNLYRSLDHGDSWTEISDIWHMDVNLEHPLSHGVLRTRPSDPTLVRVHRHFDHIRSTDYCASWRRFITPGLNVREFTFTDDNPSFAYLAKNQVYVGGPDHLKYHTIFVSEDEGVTFHPKSGHHPELNDGGGDSIPWNCGGTAHDGILPII